MSIFDLLPHRSCRHMGRKQQLTCLLGYSIIFCLITFTVLNRKYPGYLGISRQRDGAAAAGKDVTQIILRRESNDLKDDDTHVHLLANFIFTGNATAPNNDAQIMQKYLLNPEVGETHTESREDGKKQTKHVPLEIGAKELEALKGIGAGRIQNNDAKDEQRTGESVADENAALKLDKEGEEAAERTIFRPKPLTVQYYHSVLDNEPFTRRYNTCAIVSSSGQLLGKGAGEEIDSADAVIRMNAAPVKGFEPDVGKRTTLRVVCFISSQQLTSQAESILKGVGAPEKVLFWGLEAPRSKRKAQAIPKVTALQRRFMGITFFSHRHEGELSANRLFERETGANREDTNSWLSTGWFTLMTALDICGEVRVYGMVPDDHCSNHEGEKVKYHYFQSGGNPSECAYYKVHEATPKGGHRFMTEKAIFARWAQSYNLTFHHPGWARTLNESAKKIDTPFAKLYEMKGLKYFQNKQNRGSSRKGQTNEGVVMIVICIGLVLGIPSLFILISVCVPGCLDENMEYEKSAFQRNHRRRNRQREYLT